MVSVREHILLYLRDLADWEYGGRIEDFVRKELGNKASNASRRCRELENEGRIEKREVVFQGQRVVQYRYNFEKAEQIKEQKRIENQKKIFQSLGGYVNSNV